ncbi:MAG: DivIVA domain-containing protein [Ruminococcaceae bacterium]|nr:DivIVA domain-containing protein [Oscillospiraceae bacterium]
MLSPLDIENKKFVNSTVGGYKKLDVDKFKELILADYEKLYRENISFKDKINALTNALDHYKAMEDTMQSTLLVAQAASDEVRETANEKAKIIVEEANAKAEEIIRAANRELEKTNEKFEQIKREYILFKSKMKAEYEAQVKLLSEE